MPSIFGQQFGRHRFQPSAEEQVEEQGLDDVVAVVAESHFGDPVFRRKPVERAAPEPGAKAAQGLAFRDDTLHHGVSVLLDDPIRDSQRLQVPRQNLLGKIRLLLVEIDRDEIESHRGAAFQRQEDVEQRV